MKKVIAMILVLVMTLTLCACGNASGSNAGGEGGGTTEAKASFLVGYGKANITPDDIAVGMGGYGRSDQRIATGVLSYLYVTCIAITDTEGNTILMYGMDLCAPGDAAKFRGDVSIATGVPEDNIVMSASHTHSAPDYSVDVPATAKALQKLKKGLLDAAATAMEDRKPAEMFGGRVETEGINFVRHYICNDGTYAGDNFGSGASGYAGHASKADPMMQVVKFVREGDNDIWMTNFQTHPHRTGGSAKFDLSADIVGEYRTAMEEQLGVEVLYFSGAGGNINPTSRIAEENATSDFREQGKRMAKYAQSIEFTPLATGKVQTTTYEFTADINHADDSVAGVCRDLRQRWDKGEITTKELIELGLSYGIKLNSPYHAGAIYNRSIMPATNSFPIQAFSFGDVGLVLAPYEMFDTNGVYIKDHSPFAMTMIATMANGSNGYFPSELTFSYGSYEVDTTKYVCGTAEKLADQYLSMLQEHYDNR